MRWIGVTAVCLSLSSFGFYISVIYKKRIKILKDLSEFFKEFSYMLILTSSDAAEIIEKLAFRSQFCRLGFLKTIASQYTYGCNMKTLWTDAVMNIREIHFPYGSANELLLSFSEIFGKLPREEFMEKCNNYSEEFMKLSEKENEKWEKNRSLVSLSGVITAAFVFLILI